MALSCTFDVRVIDPELASRVLHHIGAALEDPTAAWGIGRDGLQGRHPGL
jgi:pyruvate/2-oxoglutarate dehydrogenase complex dihydrolipoamide acyltransferase (E2) component